MPAHCLGRKLRTLIVTAGGVNLIFTGEIEPSTLGELSSRPNRKGKAAVRLSPSIRLSPKLEGVVFYRLVLLATMPPLLLRRAAACNSASGDGFEFHIRELTLGRRKHQAQAVR